MGRMGVNPLSFRSLPALRVLLCAHPKGAGATLAPLLGALFLPGGLPCL